MNLRPLTLVVATALAVPFAGQAHAQSSTVTRTQVRDDLVQLEKAGYRPGNNDLYYPRDIQATEARIAATNGSPANADSGVGSATAGTSASGARSVSSSTNALYSRH